MSFWIGFVVGCLSTTVVSAYCIVKILVDSENKS